MFDWLVLVRCSSGIANNREMPINLDFALGKVLIAFVLFFWQALGRCMFGGVPVFASRPCRVGEARREACAVEPFPRRSLSGSAKPVAFHRKRWR